MRGPSWILAALIVGVACGTAGTPAGPTATKPTDLLFVETADGIIALSPDGSSRRSFGHAILAHDLRAIYSVDPGGSTTVRVTDPGTGDTRREVSIEGRYDLASAYGSAPTGLSPNGRWLVLAAPPAAPSRFAMIDTADGTSRRLEVPGTMTFDAVSDDGKSLYLIEKPREGPALCCLSPNSYRVRVVDVPTGALDPTPVLDVKLAAAANNDNAQTRPDGIMNGIYQTSVPAKDGKFNFSFYYNPSRGPFIHVLHLTERKAFCILDLPIVARGYESRSFWSLALAPNGRSLYAANGALGLVAEIDTATLTTRRSAPIQSLGRAADSRRDVTHGAAIGADGRRLYFAADSGIALVDTRDFAIRGRLLEDQPVKSIALSPDGRRLYALGERDARVWRLDSSTGRTLGELSVPGATALLRVGAQ